MDGVTLVADAQEAGLTMWADGDRLVVRGPRSAETIARTLLARKAEVLAVLTGAPDFPRSRVPAFARCTDETAVAWRVAAMRGRHPHAPGRPLPFLTARDVPRGGDGCLSCGEPVQDRMAGLAVRCGPCAHAGQLVNDEFVRGGEQR